MLHLHTHAREWLQAAVPPWHVEKSKMGGPSSKAERKSPVHAVLFVPLPGRRARRAQRPRVRLRVDRSAPVTIVKRVRGGRAAIRRARLVEHELPRRHLGANLDRRHVGLAHIPAATATKKPCQPTRRRRHRRHRLDPVRRVGKHVCRRTPYPVPLLSLPCPSTITVTEPLPTCMVHQ